MFDEPILKWSDDKSSEDDKTRTYSAGWTCHADSIAEAYAALSSIGVEVGSDESLIYAGINCTARDVGRIGAADLYSLTASFGEPSPDGSTTPPERRPWFVEWPDGAEQVPIDRDAFGNPIINSAGDPQEGATDDVTRYFFRITKWEARFDLTKRDRFYKTFNDDAVTICGYSFDPGQVCLREYNTTSKVEFKPTGEQVPHQIEVYYMIEVRFPRLDSDGAPIMDGPLNTGFYHRQLDAGVNGWYANNDGDIVVGNIQVPASGDGGRTTYEGVPSPVRLDGLGLPLKTDAGYRIAGHDQDDWADNPDAVPDRVVVDDSNPDAVYLLYSRHTPVAYATLMD